MPKAFVSYKTNTRVPDFGLKNFKILYPSRKLTLQLPPLSSLQNYIAY